MLAHRSQLWPVPDGMSDETAVLIEPFACAIHAAFRAEIPAGGTVHVVGAGTVGILTLIAIKAFTKADHVVVAAKHQRQRAAATMAGADDVVRPEHAVKAVRRTDHAVKLTPERGMDFLLGRGRRGDRVHGIEQRARPALWTTKAGGRVVVSGIPGGGADLTPLWFRELELAGAYTSGVEDLGNGVTRPTFEMAMELATNLPDARRSSSARPTRSTGGARHSTTRWPPASSARSRWRSRRRPRKTNEDRRDDHMPRPGFVLEVDERTPPLLIHEGEGFRMQKFPLGTRVVYPPDALPGIRDVNAAIRHALLHPTGDSQPLPDLLKAGMKLTIAVDDISIPLPPMTLPDIRQRILEQVIELAARNGVEDVQIVVATALHRRMTADEIRRMVGERVFRSFWPKDLYNFDGEDKDALMVIGTTDKHEDGRDLEAGR